MFCTISKEEHMHNQPWFPLLQTELSTAKKKIKKVTPKMMILVCMLCVWLKNLNSYEKSLFVVKFCFFFADAHAYMNTYNISVSLLCSEKLWTARQLFSFCSLSILLWTNTAPQNSVTLSLLRIFPQCRSLILAKIFSP